MNKKYLKYLMVIGLFLAMSLTANGQGSGDNLSGMLRAELERTDELIERAKDAARESNAGIAGKPLENAITLQTMAWDEFRKGTEAGFKLAGPLTREAREQAKSALASARFTQQKQDVVLRKLERASELLQRAKEQLEVSQSTQAMDALYETADNNLRNAWEFYRDGEYRPALKLSNQVDNAIRRIVNATNRDAQGASGIERYSENVSGVLESTRNQIAECDSETAIKLLEEAEIAYQLARDLVSEDKPQPAIEALKTAKKLATRARLECSGYDGSLSDRYERIKNEADQTGELLSADDNEARELLDQVYEQLDLAAGYIEDGQTQQAAASLKAAQLTLNQVLTLLEVSSTD